ncbi:MAG: hypothetical protein ACPGN3_02915 [Opitutales bacterium]
MTDRFIKNILDVPGTEGIVIIDSEEHILANAMPPYLEGLEFEDLGRRVQVVYDAVEDNFMHFSDVLLKFASKWIYLRNFENVTLVILTDPDVNIASLKMVTNLARKSITPEWVKSALEQAPPATNGNHQKASAEIDLTVDAPKPAAEEPEPEELEPVPAPAKREKAPRPKRLFRGNTY